MLVAEKSDLHRKPSGGQQLLRGVVEKHLTKLDRATHGAKNVRGFDPERESSAHIGVIAAARRTQRCTMAGVTVSGANREGHSAGYDVRTVHHILGRTGGQSTQ